jgi:RNA-binding protein 23/39
MNDEPREDDSEARSVFVSQLAARLTARDLGYFFEDKLGENTVLDARIVTDRLSRRSKGSVVFSFSSSALILILIDLESAMWSSGQLTWLTRLCPSVAR